MSELEHLIEELLGARTIYDTVRFLKMRGIEDEEIKGELQKRHGLNRYQSDQALREYREIRKEA